LSCSVPEAAAPAPATSGRAGVVGAVGSPVWWARAPVVLGLLALWLMATAGLRPLLLPDEARYGEVAREMLAGDGLVPRLNGLPFFHKPPLTYWVDIAGMALFGASPFTARLGPLLGAWLMGAALWLALRRRHGPDTAGAGLLALATCPFFYIGAQYANHDMLVAGTLAVAVLCLARALEVGAAGHRGTAAGQRGPEVDRRWLAAGWAACGLAVLAKGLIGIVLPALVIAPWLLAQGRWRSLLALLHPLGLAVFALVALPWFALMQWRYPGFFDYFIVEQHFRRFAQTGFNNQQRGWFYLLVLPALTLPWAGWAPQAFKRAAALLRPARLRWPGLADIGFWRAANDPAVPVAARMAAGAADRQFTGLMLWWLLAIVGFFSLPASKLVGYILPVLAPWCALLAPVLVASRWRWRVLAGAALLCLAIVGALAWQAPKSNRDIGLALRGQVGAQDLVVLVDDAFNDVSFEARLAQPPLVASDWADPALPLRDNWRKELVDATRFDAAAGAAVLLPISQLPQLACRGRRLWLVEPNDGPSRATAVPGAVLALQGRHARLWRAEPQACAPLR